MRAQNPFSQGVSQASHGRGAARREGRNVTARFNFKAACDAMLRELGATDTQAWYPLRLPTAAGSLDLAPQDNWLACRFDEVARATRILGADLRLNPYSGKWNWHPESPDATAVEVIRVALAGLL